MTRLALLCAVLGVAALVAAAVLGLTGVDIDVAGQSYDCGSAIGRLGGDEAETKWREASFIFNTDNANIPADELPQQACKQETDDRLTWVYVLGAVGAVLVVVALVLFFVGWRRARPARPPAPATAPPPEPAT